jgi:hypothetical protein
VLDIRQLKQLPPEILARWEKECFSLLRISPESIACAEIFGMHPVISRLTTKQLEKIVSPEKDKGIDYTELCKQILKRIIYEYQE